MVDWMFEVLTAYKMSEQTFFLSVQYLDRYITAVEESLRMDQLHLLGITCMFVASKFEDITPLFMQTLITRIGHNRFSKYAILKKEKDILRVLRFKMAAIPTVLEFAERYISLPYFADYPRKDDLIMVAKYLATLQAHHI